MQPGTASAPVARKSLNNHLRLFRRATTPSESNSSNQGGSVKRQKGVSQHGLGQNGHGVMFMRIFLGFSRGVNIYVQAGEPGAESQNSSSRKFYPVILSPECRGRSHFPLKA